MGPPSDLDQGVVRVVVRTKVYEKAKLRGRSDVTAQCSKCW
jgi:hypothetical protein